MNSDASGKTNRGTETIRAMGAVMRHPHLAPEMKVLWCLYRSYDGKGKGAWPSDTTLAEHMGKSERSVQAYRAKLLEAGYLKQQKRGPRPAIYHAVLPGAAPTPDHHQNWPWWETYLQCSAEDVVRQLEMMLRIFEQEGEVEAIPDEMYDQYESLWEGLAFPPIAELVQRGDWTAVRHELHRQLPCIAREADLRAA